MKEKRTRVASFLLSVLMMVSIIPFGVFSFTSKAASSDPKYYYIHLKAGQHHQILKPLHLPAEKLIRQKRA